MGWLLVGLLLATFFTVVVAAVKIERERARIARRELQRAAGEIGLQQGAISIWTGAKVFQGNAQGFEVRWILTPNRAGREIEICVLHAAFTSRALPSDMGDDFGDGARLSVVRGALALRFKDTLGDNNDELVPRTRQLLALAERLRVN